MRVWHITCMYQVFQCRGEGRYVVFLSNSEGYIWSMPGFNTARPTHGLVGSVFADDGMVKANFLRTISQFLDQDDGWVFHLEDSFIWYPHRLAVQVKVVPDSLEEGRWYAEMQIDLVENVEEYSEETLNLINQLNAQSAGWVVWANHELNSISISTRIPIRREEWWWVSFLSHVVPLATTVAESNADELSELSGGNLASRSHPHKGIRDACDSWLSSVRRGPREFTASLSLMITGLDLSLMQNALDQLMPDALVEIWEPFRVCVMDENELVFCMLREHWHSERGLGWQFSSIDSTLDTRKMIEGGVSQDELALAATRNMDLMLNDSWMPIMGGWVAAADFGLVRQWYLDAFLIEEICFHSQSTFGNVVALILNSFEIAYERNEVAQQVGSKGIDHNEYFAESMKNLNMKNGRLNWSNYSSVELDRNDKESLWLVPRHSLICSFGIFNPAGPTVSSLELGLNGKEWKLYFVIRHPIGAQVIEIASSRIDEAKIKIPQFIEDSIAEIGNGVLGSGPHWMDIRMSGFSDSIVRGLRRYAQLSTETDWSLECDRIISQEGDPWSEVPFAKSENGLEISGDPIDTWIELILNRDVIFGHRAFMRSAWEGAKFFSQGDFAGAQSTANAIIYAARERLLDDFYFRDSVGALIQDPFNER